MKQSRENAYAEVVSSLVYGVSKKYMLDKLAVHYPEIFLEIEKGDFRPVTFNEDIPPTPEPEIVYQDRVVETRVYPEVLPADVPYFYDDLPHWVKAIFSEYLKKDRKIQTIKKVRDYTGAGLRESKDYVDKLQERFI